MCGNNLRKAHPTLSASQRQRLLITCKHIDKLLADVEQTLNASASKGVFPAYVEDITGPQRTAIEEHIALMRERLLDVLRSQGLTPEAPHISAAHSVDVSFTFVGVAIAELAPHYMRGYGPVSEQGAADLNRIMKELQSALDATLGPLSQVRQPETRRISGEDNKNC